MTEPDRPNPDAILAQMKREEKESARGKLKVFFGMSPGVGKTYAMLQAAREAHKDGREVVIGIAETHGRAETKALLEGLPIVPRAQLEYRGTKFSEMDLEAILLWHPQIAVVDELAHTNAPGSRHPKRYQDVLELLEAGIDVFTTVNVQHIESRRDTVHQVTGILVRETVPDSVLDLTNELVLIDLTPEQLRIRLAEGKVYLGERAATAAENFFRESNLTALREMALRIVAEHVDRDLRDIMQEERIIGPWKSGERLLVAVRGGATSEKLIRYTRGRAASMDASWIVANVDTGVALDEKEQAQLNRDLGLARQLGAEVVSMPGSHVGETLLRIAQQHNVTQFVLGKPLNHRWPFRRASPVEWLLRHSGEIDIQLIRTDDRPLPRSRPHASLRWREYAIGVSVTLAVTLFSLGILDYTGYWAIALIYLLAVTISGLRMHRGPTLFLAALSALLWNFLFIPPRFTFYISRLPDFMMFGVYFVVALVIGHLATQLREREEVERRREARATALYRLARALAASPDRSDALVAGMQLIREMFQAESAIYLPGENGLEPQPVSTFMPNEKEESVAAWAFQKKQPAGLTTDTLPESSALHLPLVAADRAEGVLAVRLRGPLSLEQRELLDGFVAQLALFLHKERALHENRAAQLAAQSQKFQKTLFDCVSHELKTPLAAISAILQQPSPDRAELLQATRRLTNTVENLLDATRLESGLLQPVREWCDPGEILREAMQQVAFENHPLQLSIADSLPHVSIDARLMIQALTAILTNATIYSPPNEPIEAAVHVDDRSIVFTVADHGAGLQQGEEGKVFEKFYRGAGKPPGGLGLGLSIARRLVEAHGGVITAQNRPGGGARFTIRLPIDKPMQLPPEAAA